MTQTLKTLLKCARAIVESKDEHQTFQSICEILVSEGGFRMAWVGYANPDPEKTINPVARAGDCDGILSNLHQLKSEHPAMIAIRTGKTCWIKETNSVSIPLDFENNILGALNLCTYESTQLEVETVRLVEEWTDVLVQSIVTKRNEKWAREELKRSEAFLNQGQNLSHTGSFGWNISTGRLIAEEKIRQEERE